MCNPVTSHGAAPATPAPSMVRALGLHPIQQRSQLETHQTAADGLRDLRGLATVQHRNARYKLSRGLCHPDIFDFYRRFSRALESRGYPFHASEFYRCHDRQARLFKAGGTRHRPGESPHNRGMAADIIHTFRLHDLTRTEWNIIGAIGLEVARKAKFEISWGGDFTAHYEPHHWELTDWRNRVMA